MTIRTKIGPGGRVVIPARLRRLLGLEVGDAVTVALGDGDVRITALAATLRQAQAAVRRYAKGRSLARRLIQARRAEAKRG